MNRTLSLVYGVASYAASLVTFLYLAGFIGNFGVPKSMDSPADAPWIAALLIDLGLIAIFSLQHSVMARPSFKRFVTRFLPEAVERSTYVLASCIAMFLLFWQWRPLGGTVWNVQSVGGKFALYAGYAFGWALLLFATFLINHFDLFGLRQVWLHLRGRP